MTPIRKLQLEALDTLGKCAATIGKTLDQLQGETNEFNIEAKVYFLITLSQRLAERARRIHGQMHITNSLPGECHDEKCLTLAPRPGNPVERINMALLEETLRKEGWTMNATDFVLSAVKEKNHG